MTTTSQSAETRYGPLVAGGPSVVAVGGGHGLSRTLAAARRYAGEITAIVSVADDGGSSGRLRAETGIPAPGDIRRCIGALLATPSALGDALEYRFADGDLGGHAFGNVLLATLAATSGDFAAGVAECCALLSTVGMVVPATDEPVVLRAEVDGHELRGQTRIKATAGVSSVSLIPTAPRVPKAAVAALERADQIVVGPGSLYTSVLAALAPSPIVEAIVRSQATRTYVANLREQVPETSGYDVGAHVVALRAHGFDPDAVVMDSTAISVGKIERSHTVLDRRLAGPSESVHDDALLAGALVEARSVPRR